MGWEPEGVVGKAGPEGDEFLREQVRMLLSNAGVASAVNVSIAGIAFVAVPTEQRLWLVLICAAAASRVIASLLGRRASEKDTTALHRWFVLIVVLIALQGSSWGFASVRLFGAAGEVHRFYLLAIVCGIIGGAILFLSPSLLAFSSYALTAGGPLVFLLLTHTDETFRHAGYMGIVFLAAVHAGAARINASTRYLLASRRTLAKLSEELTRHRERLEELVRERTAELADSRESYRRLTEEINDVIFELDTEGIVTYCSPAIAGVTGHRPEDLVGRFFLEFIYPDDQAAVQQRFERVLAGEFAPFQYRVLDRHGDPHWVRSSSRRFGGEDGPEGIRGVLTDVEEVKQAEAEMVKLLQKINDNQRLEAIGTLAGGIAHDFNNLLGAIMGFTELALQRSPQGSPVREHLRRVLAASERAGGLVQQILAFSRKAEHRVERVHPDQIVREALELLSGSIPKTIEIRSRIDDETGPILADPAQFHQVVINLCTNAYQAMRGAGGVLTISLENVELDAPAAADASLTELRAGPYVLLTVEDTGPGISAVVLPKIFDPFFTTKPVGEGTGMGLAVVHGTVRSLGGAVTVSSREGEGATFRVYLPQDGASPPEVAQRKQAAEAGTERVLLVDDEEMLVALNREALSGLGYRVNAFTSAAEALEAFRRSPDAFDVVISDQTMPGMTGTRLAEEIRAVRPDIPIVVCTGYSEMLDESQAAALDIDRLVMKPVGVAGLARALRQAVAGRRKPAEPG